MYTGSWSWEIGKGDTLNNAEHQDPAIPEAIPGIFNYMIKYTLLSVAFFFFFFGSLAAERVPWSWPICFLTVLFGVEQGRSQPCRRSQRRRSSHFVSIKAHCQAPGAQKKNQTLILIPEISVALVGPTLLMPPRRAFQAMSQIWVDTSLAPPWASL